jgi:hypothetical protein
MRVLIIAALILFAPKAHAYTCDQVRKMCRSTDSCITLAAKHGNLTGDQRSWVRSCFKP